MLNRLASISMSTSVLQALPGKLDINRHSPSILYLAQAAVHSMAVVMLLFIHCLLLLPLFVGSVFGHFLLSTWRLSSFEIILMGNNELIALL